MTKPAQASKPAYQRVRTVAAPTIRLEEGLPLVVKIRSAIELSRVLTRSVLQVEDRYGAESQIVIDQALRSILYHAYPDGGYVGHWFEITRHKRVPPKRYSAYTVHEIKP